MGVCFRKVATTHRNNNVRNNRARTYSDLLMMQNQKLSLSALHELTHSIAALSL